MNKTIVQSYIALFEARDRGVYLHFTGHFPDTGRAQVFNQSHMKIFKAYDKYAHFSSLSFSDKPQQIAFKEICKSQQLRGKLWHNSYFWAKYGALGRMATFFLSFRTFSLVAATPILAATERVWATITKKNKYFFIRGYRRTLGYYYNKGNSCLVNP